MEEVKMFNITAKELEEKLLAKEELHLIDVREEEEVMTGKIPGAVHIPLNSLITNINELDKSKSYILICHSGGRSGMAKQLMEMNGFTAINMVDGIVGWNGPIE